MRSIALLFGVILINTFASGQDLITLKNQNKLMGWITEVNDSTVIYKKSEKENTPSGKLLKEQVRSIKYANGKEEIYISEAQVALEEEKKLRNKKIWRTVGMCFGIVGGILAGINAGQQ